MTQKDFIGFALWSGFNKWQKECNRILKKHSISQPQLTMMLIIESHLDNDVATSQSSLAGSAGLDKMTVSKLLRGLEKINYISRTDNPIDSRSKIIELTKSGIAVLTKAKKDFIKFEENFFKIKNKKKFLKKLLDISK